MSNATGAQEQVTCHEWVTPQEYPDDAKTPYWQCINKSATDYVTVYEGYCPTCGTGLRADGTEQARCDVVTSETVQGTEFYVQLDRIAKQRGSGREDDGKLLGLAGFDVVWSDDPEEGAGWQLTGQGQIILAALQQSPALAPAEWLAEKLHAQSDCDLCIVVSSGPCGGDAGQCARSFLAAALAATATSASADEMLDALEEGMADGHIDVTDDPCVFCDEEACELDYDDEDDECPLKLRGKQVFKVWRDVSPGMKQGMLKITADPREAARALIAQGNGGDGHD